MLDLIDLYRYADTYDIKVYDVKTGKKSLCVMFRGTGRIALDEKAFEDDKEKKRALGHELGHCETGSFYNVHSKFEVRGKMERRANIWAIQKLVSENELHQAVLEGNYEIWQLAEYFDLPEDFVEMAVNYYEGIE